MANIAWTININELSSEVYLLIVVHDDRISAQHAMPMLYSGKSKIYVAHIPVHISHPAVGSDMNIKLIKHRPLKMIVVLLDFSKKNALAFGNLVDRER